MSAWSNPPMGEPRVVEANAVSSRTVIVVDTGSVDERTPVWIPDATAETLIALGWTPPNREVSA